MLDLVCVSDLHLGSSVCRTECLEKFFLEEIPPTKVLVLGGDVLESLSTRLRKKEWRILSHIRRLSDQTKVVWIAGNHDWDAEGVAHLVGAEFCKEYFFESGGRRFLIYHGDAHDDFNVKHPFITAVADLAYLAMQKMSHKLARLAKQNSKQFLHCREKVRTEAVKYAHRKHTDFVVCGHVHHAEINQEIGYANAGCWTEPGEMGYLTVADGVVNLVRINP